MKARSINTRDLVPAVRNNTGTRCENRTTRHPVGLNSALSRRIRFRSVCAKKSDEIFGRLLLYQISCVLRVVQTTGVSESFHPEDVSSVSYPGCVGSLLVLTGVLKMDPRFFRNRLNVLIVFFTVKCRLIFTRKSVSH